MRARSPAALSARGLVTCAVCLGGLGSLALPATALAQQPPAAAASDLDRARALYAEAGELEQKGQWAAAEEKLRAAIRIRETPNLRYALAWAVENQEHLVEARAEYELALRLAQRSGNEEVSKLSMQRLSEVDHNTPLLQVRVKGTPRSDMHVFVDGREVPIRGDAGTVPVDPGSRVVRVETGNPPRTKEETLVFARGGLRVVEVEGGPGSVSLDSSPDPAAPKHSVLPWVFVGGGAALVATGIALFASSSGDASTRDEKQGQWCTETACTNGTTATLPETTAAATYRREANDAASRGNTKQAIGAVLGGVGLVGVGVGVYLLATRGGPEGKTPASQAGRVSFDAGPLPGGGHAGASFTF